VSETSLRRHYNSWDKSHEKEHLKSSVLIGTGIPHGHGPRFARHTQ